MALMMLRDLNWPPLESDLRWLYCEQKLSAAKIADAYRLKYPNPKSGETLVLYHLKKFGIARRDRAEHIRKVTTAMVDNWAKRYEAGESLKRIAGTEVDSVTVWTQLRKRGVPLRGKVEAQILAVSRHAKKPFEGTESERAYLTGLTQGDLHVAPHGRMIRIKTASTHPALFSLLASFLGGFGPCYVNPKKSNLSGFEWAFTFDLDSSFSFLLDARKTGSRFASRREFLAYLGGFFDAEGSIFRNSNGWFEISITNSDKELLSQLRTRLGRLGVSSNLLYGGPTALSPTGAIWHLRVWRRLDVLKLLELLPLRHPEKVAKARIVKEFYRSNSKDNIGSLSSAWDSLLKSIRRDRDEYVRDAKIAYTSQRKRVGTGASTIGPLPQANNSLTNI